MSNSARRFVAISVVTAVLFGGFILVTLGGVLAPRVWAQQGSTTQGQAPAGPQQDSQRQFSDETVSMAFLSAAIVVCVSCVAAGVAVGMTGSAAIGAVAERPELMGRTILFVGLAEGIAIYGLIIAIIILGKV